MLTQNDRRPSLEFARMRRYTSRMAEPPDLATLAKRYLDLWQEQLIAMAADPDLADSLARLLAGLGRLRAGRRLIRGARL